MNILISTPLLILGLYDLHVKRKNKELSNLPGMFCILLSVFIFFGSQSFKYLSLTLDVFLIAILRPIIIATVIIVVFRVIELFLFDRKKTTKN